MMSCRMFYSGQCLLLHEQRPVRFDWDSMVVQVSSAVMRVLLQGKA